MRKGCFGLVSLVLLLLVGCRSHPEIPVNDEQSLVMESSLLAAGISAEKPVLSTSDIQPSASSTLYNERQEPVTVHYRFTGMTPEGWKCILWKATQRYHSRTFGGNAVWQRQFSGGAQSQTLSIFVRGES